MPALEPPLNANGLADSRESSPVVYLDRDRESRDLLVEYFRHVPELDLIAVESIADARRAVTDHHPRVVIADSNEDFVIDLVAGADHDAPQVVVLSSDAHASTIARFRRLGVTEYLPKPIDLDRLTTVVRSMAHRVKPDREGNDTSACTDAASGN